MVDLNRLDEIRRSKKITVKDLANRVGVSRYLINRIMKGKDRRFPLEVIEDVCKALDLELNISLK